MHGITLGGHKKLYTKNSVWVKMRKKKRNFPNPNGKEKLRRGRGGKRMKLLIRLISKKKEVCLEVVISRTQQTKLEAKTKFFKVNFINVLLQTQLYFL